MTQGTHSRGTVRFFTVAAAVLLVAAQPALAESVEQVLEASGYSTSHSNAIGAIFEEARREGVPTELLLPRLQEGLAKRVPASRVAQALEADLGNLIRARSVLNEVPGGNRFLDDSGRWARAANLLAAGRRESEVKALATASASRPEAFRPASALYVSVIHWGLDEPAALALVQAAVDSSLSTSAFPGIAELIAEGRRKRIRPSQLVERLVVGLGQSANLEELRRLTLP